MRYLSIMVRGVYRIAQSGPGVYSLRNMLLIRSTHIAL